MIYRLYVEKKPGLALEAEALLLDLRALPDASGLNALRLLNRYDMEGVDAPLFEACKRTVFSEPQLDTVYDSLPDGADAIFAVEYLPGQFDQRADSAAQCVQILSRGERPAIATAKVYLLYGSLASETLDRIKKHVINPVEAREASLAFPSTLAIEADEPDKVPLVRGFAALSDAELETMRLTWGLAMGLDDLMLCRSYFQDEGRDPSETELRVLDTYWSDHCRHTTFLTELDSVSFDAPLFARAWADYSAAREALRTKKPVSLMDMGTIASKLLRKNGGLKWLDESDEINACTVKIELEVDGEKQPWLLLFKNETHNHPTEIEPFGGAATCIGGAIRDPLSGRAYVYAAMRLTGAADPLSPHTLPGKLPQRKLTTTAAAGYASYGNQIGLATGQVDELYHPGYAAKRMEIGAVIAAVPAANVRRESPAPGDAVILLGGRTGRDGCGGATGSSKSHDAGSLTACGAEVQKGNAPEERKLQRLFRNPSAARLIKRCNDFGAGGVAVAVGELAQGLDIDLDAVPKKYAGLTGTELAISESQERMAAVVSPEHISTLLAFAAEENLEATVIARVKAEPWLTMRFQGDTIVNLSRAFLDTNGAKKHAKAHLSAPKSCGKPVPESFSSGFENLAGDLNACSRRGLAERFDSTIGAGTVLMPFGGKNQLTPIQAMAHKILPERGDTDGCSFMAWGFNPFISEKSPYHGAYLAVVESVSKLIATGAPFEGVSLTFQEYFEKLGDDPHRWGKPVSALLGAYMAQRGLGVAAIGGKDSMSGSFMELDVPPTLVSFAVSTGKTIDVVSPEFKAAKRRAVLLKPEYDADGLPAGESLKSLYEQVAALLKSGKAVSAWTPGYGGVAEGVLKMCLGNGLGFAFDERLSLSELFGCSYGAFILELADDTALGIPLGVTTEETALSWHGEALPLGTVSKAYEAKLELVFPTHAPASNDDAPPAFLFSGRSPASPFVKAAHPTVLIPVFPGTNCEYDTARAFREAGAEVRPFIVLNRTAENIARSASDFALSARRAEMIFLPGGFSGGDEPDGSGKFITAFFRNAAVKEAVTELLDVRGGLMGGICNGFQALIKLGLVPYGKIMETDEDCPTLTYNSIGRHQSRIVRVRVASTLSPWLAETSLGEVYAVPISHGEGRFFSKSALIERLAAAGQIATQYADEAGFPTCDILFNPNGSAAAVEGITSPDGRVFGKMGHSERIGKGLYKNVPGRYDMGIFRSAVRFFG